MRIRKVGRARAGWSVSIINGCTGVAILANILTSAVVSKDEKFYIILVNKCFTKKVEVYEVSDVFNWWKIDIPAWWKVRNINENIRNINGIPALVWQWWYTNLDSIQLNVTITLNAKLVIEWRESAPHRIVEISPSVEPDAYITA